LLQEIYKDRKKFSKAVFEVASSDLVNMGISVVSYTLKDIRDEEVSCCDSTAGLTMWPMWQMPRASSLRGASGSRENFFSA